MGKLTRTPEAPLHIVELSYSAALRNALGGPDKYHVLRGDQSGGGLLMGEYPSLASFKRRRDAEAWIAGRSALATEEGK